jgi:tetratricopeptide (TPR) repeat protein
MTELLEDLPPDVAGLLSEPPPREDKRLLELRLAWPGLADAEARVAERLRVFLLTFDPLGWMDEREWAWATSNGDGDDYEVVCYVLVEPLLAMAESRQTSLRESIAHLAGSILAVGARHETAMRLGAYPDESAAGHVPDLLSEPPESRTRVLPAVEAVAGEWEAIGLAVIQDLVQQRAGPVDLDRDPVVLDDLARAHPGCPACAGGRFGFPADLQEHQVGMCPAHSRQAHEITWQRIDAAERSNPEGWGLIAMSAQWLSAPTLPAELEDRLHTALEVGAARERTPEVGAARERTPEEVAEAADLLAALHERFADDPEGFAALIDTEVWAWRVDDWLMSLPFGLGRAGMVDEAVRACDRLGALLPENAGLFAGDAVVILAQADRGTEALARAERAVAAWPDDPWVHAKAGDAHVSLDDPAGAEQAYRAALDAALRGDAYDVEPVADRLIDLLRAQPGRQADVTAVKRRVKAAVRRVGSGLVRLEPVRREAPKVGRNDPCPCGSGRKYKRCCGA